MSIKSITSFNLDELEEAFPAVTIHPWQCEDCVLESVLAEEADDDVVGVRDAVTTRIVDGANMLLCEEHDNIRSDIELMALAVALGLVDPMAVTR